MRVAVLLAVLPATHAIAQDNCHDAVPISDGVHAGSTLEATPDGTVSCAGAAPTPDVWYEYTALETGVLRVDTCAGADYDTAISIHSDCPGTPENELACSDDACNLLSLVELPVEFGETYLIRVGGWNGASGSFLMTVGMGAEAEGDQCQDAIPIEFGTWQGDTSFATVDGDPSCGTSSSTPDVWYEYTAVEDGFVRFKTCGTTWDTVLSLHTGCPGNAQNELACIDDACALQSIVATELEAGESVLVRVSGWNGATGPFWLVVEPMEPPADGADVLVGDLTDMQQFGRLGDVVGTAVGSPVCNAGSVPLDWFPLDQPNHPFINANMYRLMGGRLQQIGQSWIKHGFAAAQTDECGLGCIPHPNNTRLGVGCSDVYGSGTNGNVIFLGPRHELNPWTGAWSWEGSHLQNDEGPHSPIDHRLQLHDDDLDPTLNPDAEYIVELYVLAYDDENHMNSIAWEEIGISGSPGGTWSFDLGVNPAMVEPAIMSWPGATFSTVPEVLEDDGRVIIGVTTSDNGDGTWHYEYAIYNHDMDRAVRSFSLPLASRTTITNTGFYAVASHDEPFSNDPWSVEVGSGSITWSTGLEGSRDANPLRWGTMYNLWFDADAPPAGTAATLGLYKAGDPDSLDGATVGPDPVIPGDVTGDGVVDVEDLVAVILAWGVCPDPPAPCPADLNGDGEVAVEDLVEVVLNWS